MNHLKKENASRSQRSLEINRFILTSIAAGHTKDLVSHASRELGLTRQAIFLHVKQLIEQEHIVASGITKNRSYMLHTSVHPETFQITSDLEEHIVWEKLVLPNLPDLNKNVFDICFHGFTEIINNVKDHSEGSICRVKILLTPLSITIEVADDGVGIFNKLRQGFGFDDAQQAALELAKGKLTTDEQRHSGEGIFFTSRMFDSFSIYSTGFVFIHEGNDWIAREEESENTSGTLVRMKIDFDSARTVQSIFNQFAHGEDYGFVRTLVPVKLAQYGEENLVSRSQAKRVLARLERFQIVLLDFRDVDTIGQAFADEVFRVFDLTHPDVEFQVVHANSKINKVIQHVKTAT